jgi:hypothetical protein
VSSSTGCQRNGHRSSGILRGYVSRNFLCYESLLTVFVVSVLFVLQEITAAVPQWAFKCLESIQAVSVKLSGLHAQIGSSLEDFAIGLVKTLESEPYLRWVRARPSCNRRGVTATAAVLTFLGIADKFNEVSNLFHWRLVNVLAFGWAIMELNSTLGLRGVVMKEICAKQPWLNPVLVVPMMKNHSRNMSKDDVKKQNKMVLSTLLENPNLVPDQLMSLLSIDGGQELISSWAGSPSTIERTDRESLVRQLKSRLKEKSKCETCFF